MSIQQQQFRHIHLQTCRRANTPLRLHRRTVDGHICSYHKQWNENIINSALEEIILKLVQNPKFEKAVKEKISTSININELKKELDALNKRLHQLIGAKEKLGNQMDNLDIYDKHYDKKYEDMQIRLDSLYDEIDNAENDIETLEGRIFNIQQDKITENNIFQFLMFFDKLYYKFTDAEKKTFINSFVEQVDIYENKQPDGRILKHIKFRFPVIFNGNEVTEYDWESEKTVETVVLMSRKDT